MTQLANAYSKGSHETSPEWEKVPDSTTFESSEAAASRQLTLPFDNEYRHNNQFPRQLSASDTSSQWYTGSENSALEPTTAIITSAETVCPCFASRYIFT